MPLKLLEYLAVGEMVVATDMKAHGGFGKGRNPPSGHLPRLSVRDDDFGSLDLHPQGQPVRQAFVGVSFGAYASPPRRRRGSSKASSRNSVHFLAGIYFRGSSWKR
ncbi:MAG: hypothetical protein ACE5IJ_07100 [Thermoplasmata archaeon]